MSFINGNDSIQRVVGIFFSKTIIWKKCKKYKVNNFGVHVRFNIHVFAGLRDFPQFEILHFLWDQKKLMTANEYTDN